MNRLLLFFMIVVVLSAAEACVMVNRTVKRDDPLTGKIIDAGSSRSMDFDTLVNRIAGFDVIYLSEKHDNADQHHFQEKVIKALIKKKLKPSIGFEVFAMDDTSALLDFMDSGKAAHSVKNQKIIEDDLRKKVGWDEHPDETWGYYFNLLKIARNENLLVSGIDLSRSLKRRITRKGIRGISPIERKKIHSTGFSSSVYKEHMLDVLKAVHCGMGNERMAARLYDTWIARNDKMAMSITSLAEHGEHPVVIIIGGGHTEHGLGVIDRVRAINPGISQVNIGLREIAITASSLAEYTKPSSLKGFASSPPADYLRFFQRVSYEDPCVEFKKSLGKMKRKARDLN